MPTKTEALIRAFIAVLVISGFLALMLVVLLGLVNVTDPAVAKLVGSLFGFISGLLTPIITRYFGEPR